VVGTQSQEALKSRAQGSPKRGLDNTPCTPVPSECAAGCLTQQKGAGMTDWYGRGKCRSMDPNKFTPDERETKKEKIAKRVCKGCPVRQECLTFALETDSLGIFAGTNYSERQMMMVIMPSLKPSTFDESSHNDKTFQWEPPSAEIPTDIGYIPTLLLSPHELEFHV